MESKLYQLLEVLPSKMLNSIQHHLNNPNLVKKESLHLYNTLKEDIAAPNKDLNKEKVFKSIFPNQNYNDQKWRLLNSQLLKRIERYLVSQRLIENKELAMLDLLRFYREQNLKSHFESQLKSSKKYFETTQILDTNHNDALIELENEKSEFLLVQKRNQELNIQQTLDQVDIAFIIKKLKYACSALAHESVYAIDYDYGLLNSCIQEISKIDLEKHPALDLYFSCYQMLRAPDSLLNFQEFRKRIGQHQSHFRNEEIRAIYLLGINMCIKKINSGDQKFGEIGLQMYEAALQGRYLFINNKLSRYTYRNIAMMAIRSENLEWADNFTEKYKDQLKKDESTSSYNLNKANIHYYKKELELARDHIVQIDFKDQLLNLGTKELQARIYYELGEHSLLSSHLDSMEMYIIRKKIIGNYKKNYKIFISYMRKMIRLNPYDKSGNSKLLGKIKADVNSNMFKWFAEQLS